jgi:hypothetical protein
VLFALSCGQQAGSPGRVAPGRKKGPVLARVGDATLTRDELLMLFRGQVPADAPRDRLQAVLESWVNGQIWYQEAVRLGVGQDETTRLAMRNEEENLVARMLLSRVQDTITVTNADVYDYYSKHKDDYAVSTSISYLMLYDSALAERVRAKVATGTSFEAAGREFSPEQISVGEPTQFFVRSDTTIPLVRLSPELNQAIFGLEKGQISPVVRVGIAGRPTFWIVKCVDRRRVKQDVTFDKVKEFIGEELLPFKQQQTIEAITGQLMQKAKVEILIDNFYSRGGTVPSGR